MIFKQSWPGEVPVDWKVANIVPVFKKGKEEDPRNYRPASLTSVPGRVIEKIFRGSFEKHLKDSTGIGQSQHSFLSLNTIRKNYVHCLPLTH